MKRISFFIAVLLLSLTITAQPPKGPADKGMTFGEKTTAEGAVNANEFTTAVAAKPGMEIKITGKVTDVCKMMGCWLKMEAAGGTVMIKMKDESFMVPLSMNGKTIVAQGTASYKEISVEELRHYAADAGKTKEEIAAIKKPKKEMTMEASGILVL